MAFPSATKVIRSALTTFQPMWLFHLKQWQQHQPYQNMWLFHLPWVVITSASTHVAIPSATMAITSAIHAK